MRQSKVHCVIPHFSLPASAGKRALPISPYTLRSTFQTKHPQPQYRLLQRLSHQTSPRTNTRNAEHQTLFPATSRSQPQISCFLLTKSPFSTSAQTMSSDDAYMAFLNKANEDSSGNQAVQQGAGTVKTETVHSSLSVPKPLQSVDAYYTSDTDEPFEPVALKWDGAAKGSWPSVDQLSSLISPDTDLSQSISTLSPSSFDPNNQYSAALDAIRAAAVEKDSGADKSAVELKVYRVEQTSTKIEYWVLALDAPESRLVGLRAKAVES
ncbi:uncharacterized protein N7479_002929 [Penicillium vulpinum]|uniref:Uncharacterized protein n=1 Tax=Penicillium vulpinum TaxID=29845 RepID=A0A1V6RF24_9EURO|nr:uncharacterized protein N7479_002929 [Penicillium vulpinum]KAJ5973011.1 hypothetical protein N7479_002929 [Penicillium vulpinum]OQD99756.1 hypothetical protein PENVUL_c061G10164 [Penicillium vulpinum]